MTVRKTIDISMADNERAKLLEVFRMISSFQDDIRNIDNDIFEDCSQIIDWFVSLFDDLNCYGADINY